MKNTEKTQLFIYLIIGIAAVVVGTLLLKLFTGAKGLLIFMAIIACGIIFLLLSICGFISLKDGKMK